MASDSGSSFIKRNRPPRVQIQYEDPFDSEQMVELPFVMGVMSDLSGNTPGVEKAPVEERTFADVTKDTVDDYMASLQPGMTLMAENRLSGDGGEKLGVELKFESLADLEHFDARDTQLQLGNQSRPLHLASPQELMRQRVQEVDLQNDFASEA